MSALRGKADMTVCGSPLSRSLLGVKRTCLCALHMSAYDPKRTRTLKNCTERTRPQAPEAPFRRCIGVDVYVYEQMRLRRQPFSSPVRKDSNRTPRFLGDGREASSVWPCHDPCRRRLPGRGPRTPSEFCHHLATTRCRARFRDPASRLLLLLS